VQFQQLTAISGLSPMDVRESFTKMVMVRSVSTLPLSSTRALGVGLSPALFVARELSLPSLHRI